MPTTAPTVTTALALPPDPADTLHATELSDTQSVPLHPVSPIRAPALYDVTPRLAPATVMLPCPVVPWFASPTPDPDPASYEAPPVTVLDRSPAVTYVVRLPRAPPPAAHDTELSDAHDVASHSVFPR